MQCLQPSNHSKRRRYRQLHCWMPGTLLPRELLQMWGRQWMNKQCPIQTHWQHRRTLNGPALCASCRFASFNSLLNQMNMAAILWMGRCFARPVTWTWSLASTNTKTKDQAENHYFLKKKKTIMEKFILLIYQAFWALFSSFTWFVLHSINIMPHTVFMNLCQIPAIFPHFSQYNKTITHFIIVKRHYEKQLY